jgi:hypothetical protein
MRALAKGGAAVGHPSGCPLFPTYFALDRDIFSSTPYRDPTATINYGPSCCRLASWRPLGRHSLCKDFPKRSCAFPDIFAECSATHQQLRCNRSSQAACYREHQCYRILKPAILTKFRSSRLQ